MMFLAEEEDGPKTSEALCPTVVALSICNSLEP